MLVCFFLCVFFFKFLKAYIVGIYLTSRGNSNDCQQHMLLERGRYKHMDCNVKTNKLLVCALIGVCTVIRSNTVCDTGIYIVIWMPLLSRAFIQSHHCHHCLPAE